MRFMYILCANVTFIETIDPRTSRHGITGQPETVTANGAGNPGP